MTEKTTPEVTTTSRTAAATAARMRKSESKWAAHLRSRGWVVLPAHVLAKLGVDPAAMAHPESKDWARGFNDGITAIVEVSSKVHELFDE